MNKIKGLSITLVKCFIMVFAPPILFAAFYWYNNRLFAFEARILWTSTSFNEEVFQAGSTTQRASMVADLIEKKVYIGTGCREIPKMLGDPTGDYYVTETNYTYKLTDKPSANWILTLTCGNHGKIDRVFIRKSCCSLTQNLFHLGLEMTEPLIQFLSREKSSK